ncbi:MAG: HNH endonuclease [Proteobacteria bacterium]|nr:HNH endonuclease [Pseudomonadota bacterium]
MLLSVLSEIRAFVSTARSLPISLGMPLGLSLALCWTPSAHAQRSVNGLSVTTPNGYAVVVRDDLVLSSEAGQVKWGRQWDGQEWRFNPQWESLSQSWKNLTGSQAADTTGSTVAGSATTATTSTTTSASPGTALLSAGGAGGSGGGCWVWVDEDWQPSYGTALIGGLPQADAVVPARLTPFNRVMGEVGAEQAGYPPLQRVSVDYASLCAGAAVSMPPATDVEAIRRVNELYLGDNGRYAFSNRAVLEKRAVRQMAPQAADALYASLGAGRISLSPQGNDKGFRWIDKSGDWIDYNTQGQVVAYGDRNNNTTWLARDDSGRLLGVVDGRGRVLLTLHYTGQLLTEVRDHPVAGLAGDLAARSVKYGYDSANRLVQVTDVRGNVTRYGYNVSNRLTQITDAAGRSEALAYTGDAVSKHTAADGSVTDYVFEYDDANKQFISKVTGPQTEAGRRVEDLTHNRAGKVVRQLVNGRTDLEVAYDTGARAEVQTNARGLRTRTVRNEFEQVVRIEHPDGAVEQMAYAALHLQQTEATDPLGYLTRFERDAVGNLVRKVEAAGRPEERVTTYQLNARGFPERITRVGRTEADGSVTADAVWQVAWDELGQISQTTDPEGAVRRYVYDRAGNLVQYTDPRGKVTRYSVDEAGNLVGITDPLGRTRTFSFDQVGQLVGEVDERGQRTQLAYDGVGRLTQATSALGGIHKVAYNGQGLPVSETDADGRTTRSEYDNFLRLVRDIDALGNQTQYAYTVADGTASGMLGALVDPTEVRYPTYTERNRLDERERITSETLAHTRQAGPEELTQTTTYDKRGRVVAETDARGKTRRYTYDALDQLVETTDALGNKTRARHDARGNLIEVTDAKGQVSRFAYDRNDRIVQETLPLGQVTRYEHDAAGNLVRRTDPLGDVIVTDHDDAHRPTEVRAYRAGGQWVRTTRFSWDAADNLIGWTDTDATRPAGQQTSSGTATYDEDNRKVAATLTVPDPAGGSFTLSHGYQYSPAGKKTRITWPDGTAIDHAYSAHGELQQVSIPGEGTLSVGGYHWVVPAAVTLPGGSTRVLQHDGLLNLEALSVRAPNQQTVLSLAQTFGKNLELRSAARTDVVGTAASSRTTSYDYDDEMRLSSVVTDRGGLFGTDTESFTLDAVGNRIAHSRAAGAWVYDANNRLLQRGSGSAAVSYSYDEAGNLTQQSGPDGLVRRFSHDAQRRLVAIADGSGQLLARYGYDPLDRRIWREQYRDRAGNPLAQALRTVYLYADEGLIAEAVQPITLQADGSVTATAAPVIQTQYGLSPDSDFGTDVLFVRTLDTNGQPTVAYFHDDDMGRPLQATDKAGRVVWLAQYDAFGRAQTNTLVATPEQPLIATALRLPGQIEDPESGLHYNYRRYYDPETGRYLSADPLGLAGGINRYAYVFGDPVNGADPTGELAPVAAAAWAAARAYASCVAKCTLKSMAKDVVKGECLDPGKSAQDCALKCLNPFKWGKGKGKGWGGGAPPKKDFTPAPKKKRYAPPPGSRKGQDFTKAGKDQVKRDNADKNNGQMKCEHCGRDVNNGQKHERGQRPPDNEAHVDHVDPKSKGGSGTPENGQVLCRVCNLDKSNK